MAARKKQQKLTMSGAFRQARTALAPPGKPTARKAGGAKKAAAMKGLGKKMPAGKRGGAGKKKKLPAILGGAGASPLIGGPPPIG